MGRYAVQLKLWQANMLPFKFNICYFRGMANIKSFYNKHAVTISRILTIAIFLGAIRCNGEVFRLQHLQPALTLAQATPYILGGMVASTGCLLMYVLSFFNKHLLIAIVFALTISAMLWIKYLFGI